MFISVTAPGANDRDLMNRGNGLQFSVFDCPMEFPVAVHNRACVPMVIKKH